MGDKMLEELMTMLRMKHLACGRKDEMWAEIRQLYITALRTLPDQTGKHVVTDALMFSKFVPDISEILLAASRYESPTPSEDDAWSEAVAKCGYSSRQNWSHPLIEQAIKDVGGRDVIWHAVGYTGETTTISSQYRRAYDRRRTEWEQAVVKAMRKPDRDRALFPVPPGHKFHSFEPPNEQQLKSIEARGELKVITPAMPDDRVRELLRECKAKTSGVTNDQQQGDGSNTVSDVQTIGNRPR